MKKEVQVFTTSPELIAPEATNTAVTVRADCADITFVNLGASIAYINDYPLGPSPSPGIPGGVLQIEAKVNEWNDSNYVVKCAVPVGQFGLWVWRQHYTNKKEIEV